MRLMPLQSVGDELDRNVKGDCEFGALISHGKQLLHTFAHMIINTILRYSYF
jgi:hypothetical protein